jgi:hypothetical protein
VVNQFDEQNRLIVAGDNIFNSWDQFGRPTSADPVSRCAGPSGDVIAYDDTAAGMSVTFDQPGARAPDNSRPCRRPRKDWTFDSHGNTLSYKYSFESIEGRAIHYEVIAEEKLCK